MSELRIIKIICEEKLRRRMQDEVGSASKTPVQIWTTNFVCNSL